jgi:integrase
VTEVLQHPQAKPKQKAPKARGLGRTYQRGETWWVQYYDRGKLRRESSGSERESDANKLLKRRFAEIGQGRLVGPDVERTTFEDLAEMLFNDYRVNGRKSLDRAERSVEHLKTRFARSRAIDITPDRVSAYIDSRLRVAKAGTIRLELAALGRMLTLGVRAGKVSHRPYIPGIEVRNTRSGFFEEAELRAVLAQLPAELRVLVEFLHSTGWRVGEAKQLTWRQVDFGAGMVRLEPRTTKNDEGRTFHSAWREACKRARVPGRLIHDLRRTAVRNFERAGVSRSAAMKLSGHKTESIYRRYAIVSEADLAEGVRKVAALSAGGTSAAD